MAHDWPNWGNEYVVMTQNKLTVTSLGGCIVHDVVKMVGESGVPLLGHYWRRPTIALMSESASRSRFKLNAMPEPFVNYFVNDFAKLHRTEIEALQERDVVVFDITRDLFTGVMDIGNGCYIMDPLDAVGIVDGLSRQTMDKDKLQAILNTDFKRISANIDVEEFFALWKDNFVKLVEFLSKSFNRAILMELYFTDRMVGDSICNSLVSTAARCNPVLERMYAYARELGVEMVGVEREAYVTGHFVAWGGPSVTHYVRETTTRLADILRARISPDLDPKSTFEQQAYRRAADFEQTMVWLNDTKAKLSKMEGLLEAERTQRVSEQVLIAKELKSVIASVDVINASL